MSLGRSLKRLSFTTMARRQRVAGIFGMKIAAHSEWFVGLALKVDYGPGGSADCVGTCRNVFGKVRLLDAISQ